MVARNLGYMVYEMLEVTSMNKEKWRKSFIDKIKNTNWSEKTFSVKKVQFNGPVDTLQQISPEILRILKKPR